MSTLAEQVVNALKTDFDEVYQAGVEKGKAESVDLFEYALCLYNTFRYTTFNEGAEIVLNLGTKSSGDYFNQCFFQSFMESTGLKSIKINTRYKGFATNFNNFLYKVSSVEEVDLSNCEPALNSLSQAFFQCNNLRSIKGKLDVTSCTSFPNSFYMCYALEDVEFAKESINAGIQFGQSSLLSDASIQSIIDGLATVETQQTIAFHTDVKAKLTEEQKATISAKNWVLR